MLEKGKKGYNFILDCIELIYSLIVVDARLFIEFKCGLVNFFRPFQTVNGVSAQCSFLPSDLFIAIQTHEDLKSLETLKSCLRRSLKRIKPLVFQQPESPHQGL